MSKKISFYGGYTLWSAGDDAPLAFMVQELRKHLPEPTEYVVFCRHPQKEFDEYFGVHTVRNFEYDNKSQSEGKWMRGLNFPDDRSELLRIAEEIDSSDLLVMGAGNFITEVSLDLLRGHLSQFLVLAYIAELCDTPVYFYGLSANKLVGKWTKLAVQRMLRSASVITFREPCAIENLTASGIVLPSYHLLPDPSLGASTGNYDRVRELGIREGIKTDRRPVVAVSLRDLSWMNGDERYERTVGKFIQYWLTHVRGTVILVPQCTYNVEDPKTDDRYIAARILNTLPNSENCFVINGRYFYQDIQSFYGLADITIATRLHGAVFSATMGVPVIGVAYESKVTGFFQQLDMSEWCVPWDVDSEELIGLAKAMLAQKGELKRSLEEKVTNAKKQVGGYIELAVKILNRSECFRDGVAEQ